MSVSEGLLKQSVQNAVKQALIDTKYNDEPVTFGQAIVTHYFLNQMNQPKSHNQSSSGLQSNQHVSHDGPVTNSQHIHDLTKSTSAIKGAESGGKPQQVIQFDLVKQDLPEFKPQYGRKKHGFEEEATCVKEVFQWNDGYHESFRKMKLREMQRSPSKWQSEQRDQYRVFVDSHTAAELEKPKFVRHDGESPNRKTRATAENQHQDQQQPLVETNIVLGSQQLINPASQEEIPVTNAVAAPSITNEKDHHQRKVRINKENIKKRAQSAKHKVKPDPTRDNFKGPTRWLPDSAFTTYFGKPAFHAYGMGNVNPVVGGNIYGQYMLSHNVNPESGKNLPQYRQVYKNALEYGMRKNDGMRQPEMPRKSTYKIEASKPKDPEVKTKKDETLSRNPIMPEDGPKTMAARLGNDKIPTIKILPPTSAKVLKTKTPSSNPFNHPPHPTQNKKKRAGSKESNDFEFPHHAQMEEHQQIVAQEHFDNEAMHQDFSHADFALDENQDIGDADESGTLLQNQNPNVQQQSDQTGGAQGGLRYVPLCEHPTGRKVDTKELDPKYYQFVPACWTQRIRPAGKQTFKSEKLYNVLTAQEDAY